MREKELRLALVCFGGISLAVYMHGVTKEIVKLVRASKFYHATPDPNRRRQVAFADVAPADRQRCDTEAVYFELLKLIGRKLDLRVIVDVIAGASAGGINAVTMARALAFDLPLEPMREAWLKEADVGELLVRDVDRRWWSRLLLQPALGWWLKRSGWDPLVRPGLRPRLASIVKRSGLTSPFDGEHLTEVLYRAFDAMGEPAGPGASLMPVSQQLDLFVTITDCFGYKRVVPLHDPPAIEEREHRHILHFHHSRWPNGEITTDFARDNVPELAFAARATSSYPGVFPAAQIGEVDRMLDRLGRPWPRRARFLRDNFRQHHEAGTDPALTAFMDGSVLNNKPFAEAIRAIGDHAAYRQVDRRVVYIDPDPGSGPPAPDGTPPGLLATVRAALSDIPRQEPVHDDLAWIETYNRRVRRNKAVINAVRPQITALVHTLTEAPADTPPTADQIRRWRAQANVHAAREAGFSYAGYARLKLTSVLDYLADLVREACGIAPLSVRGEAVDQVLRLWAERFELFPTEGLLLRAGDDDLPDWVRFLLTFDIDFRRRRAHFVIQELNRLYGETGAGDNDAVTADGLDALKTRFYEAIDALRCYRNAQFVSDRTKAVAHTLFAPLLEADGAAAVAAARDRIARTPARRVRHLLRLLGDEVDLEAINTRVDRALAEAGTRPGYRGVQRQLLVAYLGFAFWDILVLSLSSWREVGEFEEIRVDRISPPDCTAIRQGGEGTPLKGISFKRFGAFFSRADRENDYLWGRLHAAERLIDIVCDAAVRHMSLDGIDVQGFKRQAFLQVLAAEEDALPHCPALIASLREEIERL